VSPFIIKRLAPIDKPAGIGYDFTGNSMFYVEGGL
jgi:hypothetical protein